MREKKRKIYNTAAAMFKEKGYHATSMRELAVSVGLEPSSLYSHIRSKEEILQSICLETATRFTEQMEGTKESGKSPVEQIESLVRFHVITAIEDPSSITVFNDEWRNLSAHAMNDFMEMRKCYEQDFLAIISNGIERGMLKPLNPLIMLHTILSAVKWIHYWQKKKSTFNTSDLENQIVDQVLGGIKK